MRRSKLLYGAGLLTLFTFIGHTAGLFMKIPADQIERLRIHEEMKNPVVIFPFGSPKSFADCLDGANFSLSVYLLLAGLIFLLLARFKESQNQNGILILNTLSVGAVGAISFFYFFPLPAVCLILAFLFGLVSLKRN